jgi:hypothetical protein
MAAVFAAGILSVRRPPKRIIIFEHPPDHERV